MTRTVAVLLLVLLCCARTGAQDVARQGADTIDRMGIPRVDSAKPKPAELKEIVISGEGGNLSSHVLSNVDLHYQPVGSAQDLLRLVPGLFIAQHQGGGKAEQIFLRGFDADHGTDVNLTVDGVPVNLVSHAHGQGYADLHFLIPETIEGYDFEKGPYEASKGDFTTAGYVAYRTRDVLGENRVEAEAGQYRTGRALVLMNLLSTRALASGTSAYVAADGLYSDGGPFTLPEQFHRFNGFGKFNTSLGRSTTVHLTLSTMDSRWRASGEIPNRAVAEGYIHSRFGAIDSAQGGYTNKTQLNLQVHTLLRNKFVLDQQTWYANYYFNLITNFTFFYYYPTQGDEFRQRESRNLAGYDGRISRKSTRNGATVTTAVGAGTRYDRVDPLELDHTEGGQFLGYLQYGLAHEWNIHAYGEAVVEKGHWLLYAGVRVDDFGFYYRNLAPKTDSFAEATFKGAPEFLQRGVVSPKLGAQYTFNRTCQLYIKAGKGFHSNDARVVIANRGLETLPSAYGTDLGLNWKPIPEVFVNAALWYLYLQQEFVFGQDLIDQPGGPVQPSGKTLRSGFDLSMRYEVLAGIYFFGNFNLAHPRYADSAAGHRYLPLAPTFTSTAGIDFKFKNGLYGGLSYRYMHDRAANSTYTLNAVGYWVTDATVNYAHRRFSVGLEIQNLLNVAWNESQFEYVSRLAHEARPVDEVSYTPGAPFFAKLKVSFTW